MLISSFTLDLWNIWEALLILWNTYQYSSSWNTLEDTVHFSSFSKPRAPVFYKPFSLSELQLKMDIENSLSGFLIIYIAMCLSKPKKLRGYENISIDTKYWEFLSFLSLPNIQVNTVFSPHEYKDYFLELIWHSKSRMKFYSSCY